MGYFVKASEDRETFWIQTSDRKSFRNYLTDIGIVIQHTNYTNKLEEKYKDEFATWLALRRMGVK